MKNDLSETMKLPTPIAVVSDLHLAHPATYLTDPAMLKPLFSNARSVVFNGDTCELSNRNRCEQARQKLARLLDLCEQWGLPAAFLTGNHDPLISNLHHAQLFGGSVFITHGDALHPAVAPWSKEAAGMTAERKRLLKLQAEPDDLDGLLHLTKRISLLGSLKDRGAPDGLAGRIELISRFARKPRRILITLVYWANVARYCHQLRDRYRPRARVMLIGHTHRCGVWRNRDYTLINTGSFHPLSRPLVAYLQPDETQVWTASLKRGRYRLTRRILLERRGEEPDL